MTEKQTCPKCRLIRGAALFLGFKTNLKKPLDTNTVLEHNKEYQKRERNDMQVYNMTNNESFSVGIFQNNEGTFTAMTPTQSLDFKTYKGAVKWMTKRNLTAEGKLINKD